MWGGAVTVGENMEAAAGGVAKGSTVVKIDGKNIVGVVKTAVKMYMIRENYSTTSDRSSMINKKILVD